MSRILVSTNNLPHEKWLEYRRMGIGGSDSSTVVGLNPYSSPFKLYADKKGLIETCEDTEIMRQGRDFEEYVAKRFCEETGKKVRRRNYMFQHDEYDFMLADIDREIIGEKAGLECKTTSLFNKSDFENGEIPLTYYVQMTHYMAVMGYEKMYLAVLVLSKAFYWFEINRNEEEISALIAAESDFWNNHILTDTPPEIDGSQATTDTIKAVYDGNVDTDLMAVIGDDLMLKYEGAESIYNTAKTELESVKNQIKNTLGSCGHGESKRYNISYLPQSRTTVDGAKLKKLYPEIYAECSKSSESRVLRIKEIKD